MEIKQPGMSAGKTVYKSIGFMQSVVSGCGYEYSCAATPQIRQTGNRLSGLAETAYASLLAQCFV